MTKTRLLTLALILGLGIIAAVTGFWLQQRQAVDPGRRIDFSLPDLDNRPQSARQWDGDVVVLNFWASWCPPCVREFPLLIDLQRQYDARGVQVVGIAVDRPEDARAFAHKLGANFPILHAVKPALELARAYGNAAGTLPYTMVIDRDGVVRATFATELEPGDLESAIAPLL